LKRIRALFGYLQERPAHTLVGLVAFIVAYSIYFSDARFEQNRCYFFEGLSNGPTAILTVQSLAWGRFSRQIEFQPTGFLIQHIFLPYGRGFEDVGKMRFRYNKQAKKGILKITFPEIGDTYRQGGIKFDCWQTIRAYVLQEGLSEDQIVEN
jgi:hypothetical protein